MFQKILIIFIFHLLCYSKYFSFTLSCLELTILICGLKNSFIFFLFFRDSKTFGEFSTLKGWKWVQSSNSSTIYSHCFFCDLNSTPSYLCLSLRHWRLRLWCIMAHNRKARLGCFSPVLRGLAQQGWQQEFSVIWTEFRNLWVCCFVFLVCTHGWLRWCGVRAYVCMGAV